VAVGDRNQALSPVSMNNFVFFLCALCLSISGQQLTSQDAARLNAIMLALGTCRNRFDLP